MKNLFLFLTLILAISVVKAQNTQITQTKAINNYILFSNESDHGLLIIHRLLELYNQEMNKYVDLPQYKLNLFSNDDFPENIFEDRSGSFYRVSPYELYDIAIKESDVLPAKYARQANKIITEMKAIMDDLEKERYSIGTLIANTDLNKVANLKNVYSVLDACVVKYDAIEAKRKELHEIVEKMAPKPARNDAFYKSFIVHYKDYLESLHHMFDVLRSENIPESVKADASLLKSGRKLQDALNDFAVDGMTQPQSMAFQEMKSVLNKQIGFLEKYSIAQTTPEEYKLYGPCYYMYNIQLAGTTNKYGTGVVERGNEWIKTKGENYIYGFERPHFYKVIRPKLIQKDTIKHEIAVIPVEDEHRKIVVDKSKGISTKVEKLLIEVYDNQEFDHDTISLKFNGEWILQKQLITKEPIRLYLPLVKGQDNYLILYADNLGSIPPNTCAIRWVNEKGKYNEVVMKSDFNTSEMIVIRRE